MTSPGIKILTGLIAAAAVAVIVTLRGVVEDAPPQAPAAEVAGDEDTATEAVRAVGTASGANPIPLVIPCHRVIGSDGSLTGYGGGLWRKRWLITHERRMASQSQDASPQMSSVG